MPPASRHAARPSQPAASHQPAPSPANPALPPAALPPCRPAALPPLPLLHAPPGGGSVSCVSCAVGAKSPKTGSGPRRSGAPQKPRENVCFFSRVLPRKNVYFRVIKAKNKPLISGFWLYVDIQSAGRRSVGGFYFAKMCILGLSRPNQGPK